MRRAHALHAVWSDNEIVCLCLCTCRSAMRHVLHTLDSDIVMWYMIWAAGSCLNVLRNRSWIETWVDHVNSWSRARPARVTFTSRDRPIRRVDGVGYTKPVEDIARPIREFLFPWRRPRCCAARAHTTWEILVGHVVWCVRGARATQQETWLCLLWSNLTGWESNKERGVEPYINDNVSILLMYSQYVWYRAFVFGTFIVIEIRDTNLYWGELRAGRTLQKANNFDVKFVISF